MQFIEIPREDMPILNPMDFPDYYCSGIYEVGDRVFKLENTYLELSVDEGVALISMISTDRKGNLFAIKNKIDELLNEYDSLGFYWVEGIRNEVFIKRLLKNYEVINTINEENGYITKIFTRR
ncbi:MAG: hypothetical protein ACRDDH_09235 [Cetobacterium sp.]|uniref:hypothetical protein n=1 Tax=Cetobacterium sp. TaxID=2071632 RepID=UPI003EE62EB5